MTGHDLPKVKTNIPGTHSRALAQRLARVESPNITYIDEMFPIFWKRALGANVEDADGNVYIDLTSAFGVQGIGHSHPLVVEAISRQAENLIHGMGDVHPTELKIQLAEKISEITPGDLRQVIFSSSGSEAVESALKTACLYTRKPGIIAFEGAYHGLTYGALAATHRRDFRAPFADQISPCVVHIPFPGNSADQDDEQLALDSSLDRIESVLSASAIGAVLIEPIQGRGGVIIPPAGFLTDLKRLCLKHGALLILDEIMTGFGRTGKWFACDHENMIPDILILGKGMTGGFPISACVATEEIMSSWGRSTGEAIHTSTFLGSPLGCASALATIKVLENEKLIERSEKMGAFLLAELRAMAQRHTHIRQVRGRGLLVGVELSETGSHFPSGANAANLLVNAMLQDGIVLLASGPNHNVLSFTPPFVITENQIRYALTSLEEHITSLERKASYEVSQV